jgi:hypothetical protein
VASPFPTLIPFLRAKKKGNRNKKRIKAKRESKQLRKKNQEKYLMRFADSLELHSKNAQHKFDKVK